MTEDGDKKSKKGEGAQKRERDGISDMFLYGLYRQADPKKRPLMFPDLSDVEEEQEEVHHRPIDDDESTQPPEYPAGAARAAAAPAAAAPAAAAAAAAAAADDDTVMGDDKEAEMDEQLVRKADKDGSESPSTPQESSAAKGEENVYSGYLTTQKEMRGILKMLGIISKDTQYNIIYYSKAFMYYYHMLKQEYELHRIYRLTTDDHFTDKQKWYIKGIQDALSNLYRYEVAYFTNEDRVIIFCPRFSLHYVEIKTWVFKRAFDIYEMNPSEIRLRAHDGTKRFAIAYLLNIESYIEEVARKS